MDGLEHVVCDFVMVGNLADRLHLDHGGVVVHISCSVHSHISVLADSVGGIWVVDFLELLASDGTGSIRDDIVDGKILGEDLNELPHKVYILGGLVVNEVLAVTEARHELRNSTRSEVALCPLTRGATSSHTCVRVAGAFHEASGKVGR